MLASAALLLLSGVAERAVADDDAPDDSGVLTRHQMTGDWNGMRPLLESHGFRPYLTYTGLMWSNLGGGLQTGTEFDGYLDFGLEVDFEKAGLWKGGGLHADFHWFQGREPTAVLAGGLIAMAVSGWEAASTFRVYNIYYRQSLADDGFIFKIGQLAADTDFMVSRYGGILLNAAFGDLPSQNLNIDAPVYPLAGPGVTMIAKPASWFTGRFGAYTGDPGDDVASNHGFQGQLGNNAGYSFFLELAAAPEMALPGNYTLGAVYDTGGSDQFGTGVERKLHYEFYGMIDQALTVDDQSNPKVGVFARMAGSPQDTRNVVGLYADGGFAVYAPIASRPNDVLGLGVSVLRFTNDIQNALHLTVGGEAAVELTYQASVTPWLVVQPDFQFLIDPPFATSDAHMLGVELVAVF